MASGSENVRVNRFIAMVSMAWSHICSQDGSSHLQEPNLCAGTPMASGVVFSTVLEVRYRTVHRRTYIEVQYQWRRGLTHKHVQKQKTNKERSNWTQRRAFFFNHKMIARFRGNVNRTLVILIRQLNGCEVGAFLLSNQGMDVD